MKFNSFHYDLHKIYVRYGTQRATIKGGTSFVNKEVWHKLCMRWGSNEFKLLSLQNKANRKQQQTNHTTSRMSFARLLEEKNETMPNLVEFFKESQWSKKKNGFVTDMTEDL